MAGHRLARCRAGGVKYVPALTLPTGPTGPRRPGGTRRNPRRRPRATKPRSRVLCAGVGSVALDQTHVYWTEFVGDEVMRLSKAQAGASIFQHVWR